MKYKNKADWFEKNGISEDGKIYCIYGDDTYAIKEKLKELGCRFSPILKWYSAKPIELPEGYHQTVFTFDELYEWDDIQKIACFYENAKNTVERRIAELVGPSKSEYFGTVNERFYDKTVVYKSKRGFAGMYGWTNIYTFEAGDNVLVWFTACELDVEPGDVILLTGTVKKHEEFRGVKTTQLSRCKTVKIEK